VTPPETSRSTWSATKAADVIRPHSVLRVFEKLAVDPRNATIGLLTIVVAAEPTRSPALLDGGAIPSSTQCIFPARWHFLWSWAESNRLASAAIVPGRGATPLVRPCFRVSGGGRE
jgi:hypothetical protein